MSVLGRVLDPTERIAKGKYESRSRTNDLTVRWRLTDTESGAYGAMG